MGKKSAMKVLLITIIAAVFSVGCVTSQPENSDVNITSIFANDTLIDRESDGSSTTYTYSTNTHFEKLKIALVELLGSEWSELETKELQLESKAVFINPKQPDKQIWLSQKERVFTGNRFVASLTILTGLPILKFEAN
jgi:hypothetical protein